MRDGVDRLMGRIVHQMALGKRIIQQYAEAIP